MPPSPAPRTPVRAIALLAAAAFAAQAMVRVMDSLLPQIAVDLGTTVGAASIVVTAYAVTHGSVQLVIGPIGDMLGKYRTITAACGLASIMVLMCGLAQSLGALALARLASGLTAAWVIPLSMAYVGDVTPYECRQQVLGRYLSGQIAGQLFGQAAGGILGDLVGWRGVFFLLAGLFALATIGLVRELATNPTTRDAPRERRSVREAFADYGVVLRNPWARTLIFAVFVEGALAFGIFTYIGADLHLRFGLSFTLVGIVVAAFGVGGLVYAASVRILVARLGPIRIAMIGGLVLAFAYFVLAVEPNWWFAPLATGAIGLGFYMMHNTMQTHATQMTPEARGTAVALFSSALYLGQTAGVAIGGVVVDRFGAPVMFAAATLLWPIFTVWFVAALKGHARTAD